MGCSYAPWCNHCQQYAKTYDRASLEVTTLKFGKVDCVAQKSLFLARWLHVSNLSVALCTKYNVVGYPTMKLHVHFIIALSLSNVV